MAKVRCPAGGYTHTLAEKRMHYIHMQSSTATHLFHTTDLPPDTGTHLYHTTDLSPDADATETDEKPQCAQDRDGQGCEGPCAQHQP